MGTEAFKDTCRPVWPAFEHATVKIMKTCQPLAGVTAHLFVRRHVWCVRPYSGCARDSGPRVVTFCHAWWWFKRAHQRIQHITMSHWQCLALHDDCFCEGASSKGSLEAQELENRWYDTPSVAHSRTQDKQSAIYFAQPPLPPFRGCPCTCVGSQSWRYQNKGLGHMHTCRVHETCG